MTCSSPVSDVTVTSERSLTSVGPHRFAIRERMCASPDDGDSVNVSVGDVC